MKIGVTINKQFKKNIQIEMKMDLKQVEKKYNR